MRFGDVVVQREGSAVRNAQELLFVFLDDARAIALEFMPDWVAQIDALLEISREYDLEDIDGRAGLEFCADDAENVLSDHDFYTRWDDGYQIVYGGSPAV